MAKKLYLMRHGQTLFNIRRMIQGASDSPLTEVGIKQAQIAKQYFENNGIVFDYAYSSTQERAVDTLELVTDMPYERLKGLKEWNFGTFEGESEDLNPKVLSDQGTYGDFFAYYNGESDLEVQNRMVQTLTELMEKEDHQNILAVSHGGACTMFRKKWTGTLGNTRNCSILVFDYDEGVFTFQEVIDHDFSLLS